MSSQGAALKKQLVWVICERGARRVLVAHGLYRNTKPPYRISEQERFVNFKLDKSTETLSYIVPLVQGEDSFIETWPIFHLYFCKCKMQYLQYRQKQKQYRYRRIQVVGGHR